MRTVEHEKREGVEEPQGGNMISLFGALLGFLGSIVPTLLKLYQDKQDKQHELKLLELQMQAQAQLHTEKMEEISAQADIEESKALYEFAKPEKSGVLWVDAIIALATSLVRPLITYSFFGLYAWVKLMLTKNEAQLWTEFDTAIFSTVIAFWFGQRAAMRAFNKWQ